MQGDQAGVSDEKQQQPQPTPHSSKTLIFLPPIKHNKLNVASNSPVFIENNMRKEKTFLAVGVEKFSILTNQPKYVSDKVKLTSYSAKSSRHNNHSNPTNMERFFPNATSLNFKWDSKEMPKLRVLKANKEVPRSVLESADEKKKRLIFEQKVIIEQKHIEKSLKDLRTIQLLTHSNDTLKKINKYRPSFNWSNDFLKPDIWNSIDFRDINLQNDIINHMYSLDNRVLRKIRATTNPDFFKCKPNKCFDNGLKSVKKAEEENQPAISINFTSN